MPLFTKSLKLKAFNKKRFGRYLLYALGEIILVVAGILIALEINNRNEAQKQLKLRNSILRTVSTDLVLDTLVLNQAIQYYEIRDTLSVSIVQGKYSRDAITKCFFCPSMNISYFPLIKNEKGYQELKNFNQESQKTDSLIVGVMQYYSQSDAFIDDIGKRVEENSVENIKYWKEHYSWFSDLVTNTPNEDFFDYMAYDQDFKNRTAYFNIIACKNYLNYLRQFKTMAIALIGLIEEDLKDKGV